VDDDHDLRETIAADLEENGCDVLQSSSGTEACNLVTQKPVSVAIVDWNLGSGRLSEKDHLTGAQIIRACRRRNPLLPVIVLSGDHTFDARSDAIMLGADSFLAKPVPLALLRAHLARWLIRAKTEQNPFIQLQAGVFQTADAVTRSYARAVVKRVGSVLQAAPKLGLSRQTVTSYVASDPSEQAEGQS
jgi:DNA-binding response OmpR family regulator